MVFSGKLAAQINSTRMRKRTEHDQTVKIVKHFINGALAALR